MDISKLMQMAQDMQKRMTEMQAELEKKNYTGSAAGGMVTAVVNGRKQLVSLNIERELWDEQDKDMLQDVVVAAVNQAQRQADEGAKEELAKVTGGLPIPPGLLNIG